jgi:hypothetical protein
MSLELKEKKRRKENSWYHYFKVTKLRDVRIRRRNNHIDHFFKKNGDIAPTSPSMDACGVLLLATSTIPHHGCTNGLAHLTGPPVEL